MIDWLNHEIEKNGDRAAVVPVGRLQDLRRDVEVMQVREDLNNFQKLYSRRKSTRLTSQKRV